MMTMILITEQFIHGKIFNQVLPYDAVKVTSTLPMVPPNFECVTNETLHERLEKLHVESELKVITQYLPNITIEILTSFNID